VGVSKKEEKNPSTEIFHFAKVARFVVDFSSMLYFVVLGMKKHKERRKSDLIIFHVKLTGWNQKRRAQNKTKS
jgi:hypothetical protein